MGNLITTPIEDNFETTLSQAWNGLVGTIYVNNVPSSTLPSGEKTYVVVNPGKSTQQVARISGWTTGQLTCDSVAIEKGAGLNYTAVTHAVQSKVIISDNYQFWKDIKNAINSKVSTDTNNTWTGINTFDKVISTGYIKDAVYADATARDTAIPTPSNGMRIYNTAIGLFQKYQAGIWTDETSGGSTPNASTTVAGKVEKATPTEITNGTSTGGTGAELFVGPDNLKLVTDNINNNINNVTLVGGFGDGIDGDVTITTSVSLTRDMYYNNLTLNSPGILNPNGFRIFVKGTFSGNGTIRRNGNNGTDAFGSTIGLGGEALNQGSMNSEIGGSNTLVDGITADPSYHNVNGANAGTSGAGSFNAGYVPTAGLSIRGSRYNVGMTLSKLLELLPISASGINSLSTLFVQYKGIGGGAGGGVGGSGNGGVIGSYGGGSGGNGGTIYIQSKIRNFTGLIEGKGGNGGNGSSINGEGGSNRGGGGGAAGGSGSVVIAIGKTFTSIYGTLILTGGVGGTGGGGSGIGVAGTSGNNGTAGILIQITAL